MEPMWLDLRYAVRKLLKQPAFALVVVITLALGIGANSAIFSLVDKLLLRSLPVREPQQLVSLSAESVNAHFLSTVFSYPDYLEYRDRNQVFSDLIAFGSTRAGLGSGDQAERLTVEIVSGNYFDALGIEAVKGRLIDPEDDKAPGAHPVLVLSYGCWQRRFGADPNVAGRTIEIKGTSYTIIGVARRGFNGMRLERPADAWAPMMMLQQLMHNQWLTDRTSGWLEVVGRLRTGVTIVQAQTEMDAVARQVRETLASPAERSSPFYEKRMLLDPGGKGKSILRNKFSQPLTLLMAVVAVILLISCANVATLLLARSAGRRKEVAIRLALGAGRARIIRQLLTESLLLALAGGAAGLVFAPWLTKLLLAFQPQTTTTPPTLNETLDGRMLAFTVLVSLLSGIVFGLAPALQTARADLAPALKEDDSSLRRRERHFNARYLLVVAQVTLSFMVLVSAGLFIRSLQSLWAVNLGFRPDNVLLVPIDLPEGKYDEARGGEFYPQVLERLKGLPGVTAVSSATVAPMEGGRMTRSLMAEGSQAGSGERISLDSNNVGPGYHELMGIQLAQGRGFTERDNAQAPGVVIINEAMARLYFPDQNPLGKPLREAPGNPPLEIVGIARDSKFHDLREPPLPHFDLPLLQRNDYGFLTLHLRTTGDAASLLPAVRRELMALEPDVKISMGASTLAGEINQSIAPARMATTLTGLLGLFALLLTAIGLYGVMAYSVTQRTREIGIRIALGAPVRDVLRVVITQGMVLALVGVAIGVIAASGLTRFMRSLLFEVRAVDPLTFSMIAVLLMMVAFLACWLPARRASRVDPMVALRHE